MVNATKNRLNFIKSLIILQLTLMNDELKIYQQLRESQKQFVDAIRPFYLKQDWRLSPGEWSFREVAAHMATTEEECFKERVRLIASGQNPEFEYYLNDGRDFSHLDLEESIHKWRANREEIILDLKQLPDEAWENTGVHLTFGTIKLVDLLKIMLDHDLGHLQEMQPMIEGANSSS